MTMPGMGDSSPLFRATGNGIQVNCPVGGAEGHVRTSVRGIEPTPNTMLRSE
jgi:hypothetical protein